MDFLFGSIAKLTTPRPPPAAHSGGGPPRPHFDLMEAIRHFSDKRIIITGCTGAVGSIVATRLIQAGAKVALFYRNREKISELLVKIPEERYQNLKELHIDLSNPITLQRRFREAVMFLKGIDSVITCHGMVTHKSINIATIKDFDEVNNLNVRSVFHLIGMASPFLKDSGGNIVCLSSASGVHPKPGALTDCVSYSMLNMLVQNAAIELANDGIRVNAVAPLLIDSFHRSNKKGMQLTNQENMDFLNKEAEHMPLNKTPIKADQVAESIMWLASDDASFVTGEILVMDGGIGLASPNYKEWITESVSALQAIGGAVTRTSIQFKFHNSEAMRRRATARISLIQQLQKPMASNESENSIQSPPLGQYLVVVEQSEVSVSSSNQTNPLISVDITCRSNNSGNRASQFSKSISGNRSSEESNRDSSKDELFSKKSTESNHILRIIIEGVLSEVCFNITLELIFSQQSQWPHEQPYLQALHAQTCRLSFRPERLVQESKLSLFNRLSLVSLFLRRRYVKTEQITLFWQAHFYIKGLSYLANGNPELALSNFESALIFLPDIRDPNLWIAIATALQQIRRPQIALQAYHRVLKLVPRFPHLSYIHFHLACLEQCLGFYDLAIQHYKQAVLDNFPNNSYRVNALARIAYCQASKGHRKLALNSLQAAISFDRSNVQLYHRLACFHYQQGNLQKMEDTLQAVLRIEPTMWCTHYLLGRLCDIKEESAKAKMYLLDAMKYSSKLEPEVMCTLGVWAAKNNKPYQALEAFKQAVLIDEFDLAWHNIGVLYQQHNQYSQAAKAFEKAKKTRQRSVSLRRDDWDHYQLPEIEPHREIFIDPPFYKKVSHKPFNLFPMAANQKLPVFFQNTTEYQKVVEELPILAKKSETTRQFNHFTVRSNNSCKQDNSMKSKKQIEKIVQTRPQTQMMELKLSQELTQSAQKRGDGTPQLYVKTSSGYVPVCLVLPRI